MPDQTTPDYVQILCWRSNPLGAGRIADHSVGVDFLTFRAVQNQNTGYQDLLNGGDLSKCYLVTFDAATGNKISSLKWQAVQDRSACISPDGVWTWDNPS